MIRTTDTDQNGSRRLSLSEWREHRMELVTKSAVVTGGARGIGRATCVALAREGIRAVGVVDMADDLPNLTCDANRHFKRDVLVPFRGDVADPDFRRHVFEEMERRFECVSICVPAAGITRDRLAVKLDKERGEADIYPESDFQRVLEIDLVAPVYWAMQTIASVARHRHRLGLRKWEPSEPLQGCIVFIGSVSSSGNRGQVAYATAKAGLEGAQATLAAEAIFYGVRSAIIHPGYTDTGMVGALGEGFVAEHILPNTQLRRLIMPEEIADAICFMIRNASVSGQLWADAGWHPSP